MVAVVPASHFIWPSVLVPSWRTDGMDGSMGKQAGPACERLRRVLGAFNKPGIDFCVRSLAGIFVAPCGGLRIESTQSTTNKCDEPCPSRIELNVFRNRPAVFFSAVLARHMLCVC